MNKPLDSNMVNSPPGKNRTDDRNSLLLKAVLRFPASKAEGEVRVRNLSSGGLMAEAAIQASRGEVVEVNLKNLGWITGRVAWIAESRFGVAFDYPIDPKAARQSISSPSEADKIPHYLKKLDRLAVPKAPLRRI